jgi:hypothetical protein
MLGKTSSSSVRPPVYTSQDIDGESVPPRHPSGRSFLNAWAMLHRREEAQIPFLPNQPSCDFKVELKDRKRIIWLQK